MAAQRVPAQQFPSQPTPKLEPSTNGRLAGIIAFRAFAVHESIRGS
jgi:hypothetical protein